MTRLPLLALLVFGLSAPSWSQVPNPRQRRTGGTGQGNASGMTPPSPTSNGGNTNGMNPGAMGNSSSGMGAQPMAENPCMQDMKSLCADSRSGGPSAVRDCMRSHKDQLSDACRSFMRQKKGDQSDAGSGDDSGADDALVKDDSDPPGDDAALGDEPPKDDSLGKSAGSQPAGPCFADVEKFCKGLAHGGGRVYSCLKSHQADLSPACKQRVAQAGDVPVEKIASACSNEAELLCKGMKSKGRLLRCLLEHQDDATSPCKAELDLAKPILRAKRELADSQ